MKKISIAFTLLAAFFLGMSLSSTELNNDDLSLERSIKIQLKEIDNQSPRTLMVKYQDIIYTIDPGEKKEINEMLSPPIIFGSGFSFGNNPRQGILIGDAQTQEVGYLDISRFNKMLRAAAYLPNGEELVLQNQILVTITDPMRERYGLSLVFKGNNLENSQITLTDLNKEFLHKELWQSIEKHDLESIKKIAQQTSLLIKDEEGKTPVHKTIQRYVVKEGEVIPKNIPQEKQKELKVEKANQLKQKEQTIKFLLSLNPNLADKKALKLAIDSPYLFNELQKLAVFSLKKENNEEQK